MTGILVLGGGSIGKRHMGNILSLGVPPAQVFAVEPRADRQAEVVAKGVLRENIFSSRDEALAAGGFDRAVVATPTSMHYDDAIALARQGVSVCIEKPLAADLSRIDELFASVRERGVYAMVAYCFRFDEMCRTFKRLLDDGAIGRPLYTRAEMSTYLPAWHPWEDYRTFYMAQKRLGGGTLLDQSHLFDMARFFFGDVAGLAGVSLKCSDLEIDTDDFGEFYLEMKSGMRLSMHIDLFTQPDREFFQVTGTKGTLEWVLNKRVIRLLTPEKEEVVCKDIPYDRMYVTEMQHFLAEADKGPHTAWPSLDDARAAMDVVEAIRISGMRSFVTL